MAIAKLSPQFFPIYAQQKHMKKRVTFNAGEEKIFLNSLVADYGDQQPYSKLKKDIILGLIDEIIQDGLKKSGMQMGCANGYETEQLARRLGSLTVVDGAKQFVEKLSNNNGYTHVNFFCSLFEEMHQRKELSKRFDYVFCNYVLEHVSDVQIVLGQIKKMLKPEGTLFVVVPNRDALSRRLAKEMGLVPDLKALTENDHKHGHRRTFSRISLLSEIRRAGFTVERTCGVVLKILADFQLNELLNNDFLSMIHIQALQRLALKGRFSALADSICVVAHP